MSCDASLGEPRVSFDCDWHVLGPFQIGTRELPWGADPLQKLGGFHALDVNNVSQFESSIATGGRASWSTTKCKQRINSAGAHLSLSVGYGDIAWSSIQQFYGWSALQWQGWSRGTLHIFGPNSVTAHLHLINALEIYVDDAHFFGGDLYAQRRAPIILALQPGAHVIEVRLAYDMRSMGLDTSPTVKVGLLVELQDLHLHLEKKTLILPESIDGRLAGRFGSVVASNNMQEPIIVDAIDMFPMKSPLPADPAQSCAMMNSKSILLVLGQSRPLPFRFATFVLPSGAMRLRVTFHLHSTSEPKLYQEIRCEITARDRFESHRITYMHPSQIVSFATLRPPLAGSDPLMHACPILLNLHGAGLEADSEAMRKAFDEVPHLQTWILTPSGVTSWSGDDWHDWGLADVRSAIASLSTWMEATSWNGPTVMQHRWLVVGHSNGGQGVWFTLSHEADKIIGAAVVSGYSSIQNYVPYDFWIVADSCVAMHVQNALKSYRHELLLNNATGIPIMIQHGDLDDNVPVHHGRHMYQLAKQSSLNVSYQEIPNGRHWSNGILTTQVLRDFYQKIVERSEDDDLPLEFSITAACPEDNASRAGILIEQLIDSVSLGTIHVKREADDNKWRLHTRNVRCITICAVKPGKLPLRTIELDGQIFDLPLDGSIECYVRGLHTGWQTARAPRGRSRLQTGPLHAIMRTRYTFCIRPETSGCASVALQIARNLLQYFGADSQFVDQHQLTFEGNIISISMGIAVSESWPKTRPITITKDGELAVSCAGKGVKKYSCSTGMGMIFLSPLPNDRLELVIWGFDDSGLRLAARLMPMLTGTGQPEFVVVSKCMTWKGAQGALAMGTFDNSWEAASSSHLS